MYRDKGEALKGWITDIDDYVDDANYFHLTPYHLYLPIINQEDNQDAPKDFPKNFIPEFISNPFILFWSIYYTSYINNKQIYTNYI